MAKLIVIDGLDGSGKKTQVEKLAQYLKDKGKKVYIIDFPAYDSESSALVKMYLNGDFGKDASSINPYVASSFYAGDRVAQYILDWRHKFNEEDSFVIANRYLSANIIHQGCKIKDLKDKYTFYEWVYDYECKLMGLPVEDITIYLSVDIEVSRGLILNRYNGDRSKMDIHEADLNYLNSCYENAQIATDFLYKKGYPWVKVECCDNKRLMSIEEVFDKILCILKSRGLLEE